METPEEGREGALRQMLEGDEGAFRLIYREVHPPLLRYLGVLVGTDDAEDVASETWAQVFRDLDRFSGDLDGFRGWVTTIARNRAMDHLRRRSRRPVADDLELAAGLPDAADVEAAVADTFSTDGALALIRSLPKEQAEAVMLRVVLGFDAVTAAAILGKRPGAVRTAAHRGLASLARQLGDARIPLSAVTLSILVALLR